MVFSPKKPIKIDALKGHIQENKKNLSDDSSKKQ